MRVQLRKRHVNHERRKGRGAMRELQERIERDGVLKEGGVLKVGAFLNHQ